MKILFIHGDTRSIAGGAETLLRDQANELTRQGHEVAWYYGDGHISDAIRDFRPDICHLLTIHCYPMGMEPAVYLQENNIPHVWHIQDYWPFCAGRMLLVGDKSCSAVEGVCQRECRDTVNPSYLEICNKSFIVAGNQNTADIYIRNGLRCDAVVELGVDTDLFSPGDAVGKLNVITSCGWPEQLHKGMHILERALQGTDYEVTLITGLPREEVAAALKKAHVFIFPSVYEETFGLSLCEGMSAGLACISSDVAGAKAQIEDGVTGLLVPKGDADALRDAINRVMQIKNLRYNLGQASREHVIKCHSLQAMTHRWLKVYKKVLNDS